MAGVLLKAPWTTKPPLGTRIDWGHPLAQGLVFFGLFNEGGGQPTDIVSGRRASKTVPPWRPGGLGFTGAATNYGFARYPPWEPSAAVTVLAGVESTADAFSNAQPFVKTYANNTTPFASWTFYFPSATTGVAAVSTGGTFHNTASVTTPGNFVPFVFGSMYDGATLSAIFNGRVAATLGSLSGAITYDTTATGDLYLGSNASTSSYTGIVYWAAVWSRPLTAGELRQVSQDPYQFLISPAPTQRYWFSVAGAPPASGPFAPVPRLMSMGVGS